MPNLERRYTPEDSVLMDAWLFGLIDALEFLQHGHAINQNRDHWFEVVGSQLIEDISTYAQENWKDEFANFETGSPVPVPAGSSGPDSSEETSTAGGPARPWKDLGGFKQHRGVGPVEPSGLSRDTGPYSLSKRSHSMDKDDRELHLTEIPTNGCGGSGHWFIDEEGNLIGNCSCFARYIANNRHS